MIALICKFFEWFLFTLRHPFISYCHFSVKPIVFIWFYFKEIDYRLRKSSKENVHGKCWIAKFDLNRISRFSICLILKEIFAHCLESLNIMSDVSFQHFPRNVFPFVHMSNGLFIYSIRKPVKVTFISFKFYRFGSAKKYVFVENSLCCNNKSKRWSFKIIIPTRNNLFEHRPCHGGRTFHLHDINYLGTNFVTFRPTNYP